MENYAKLLCPEVILRLANTHLATWKSNIEEVTVLEDPE